MPHTIAEIVKFKEALKHIHYDTWLVVDLDNTVMTSGVELGGDAWFVGLCEHAFRQPLDPSLIMGLVLSIYNQVQQFVRALPAEPEIVMMIKALQDVGIPVLGLTARGYLIRQPTVRQLADIDIDFSINCLEAEDDESYDQGIIYCNGQNKGDFLKAFLEKNKHSPKHIVMLDDKGRHLSHVKEAVDSLEINFHGFRYGFLDKQLQSFDMSRAHRQLADLKEHLPVNVQEAIIQLNLPEERSTSPSVEKNFFRPEEEAPVNPSVMPLRRAKSLYPFFSDRHQEPVFRDRGAMSVPAQEHQNSML